MSRKIWRSIVKIVMIIRGNEIKWDFHLRQRRKFQMRASRLNHNLYIAQRNGINVSYAIDMPSISLEVELIVILIAHIKGGIEVSRIYSCTYAGTVFNDGSEY